MPDGNRIDELAIIGYRMVSAWVADGKVQIDASLYVYFHNHHIIMTFTNDQEAEEMMKELDIISDKSLYVLDKVQRTQQVKHILNERFYN